MAATEYTAQDVERLAEAMYRAWCALHAEKTPRLGTVKWFALRVDLKALWRLHAQLALQAIATLEGDRRGGPDQVIPAAVGQE